MRRFSQISMTVAAWGMIWFLVSKGCSSYEAYDKKQRDDWMKIGADRQKMDDDQQKSAAFEECQKGLREIRDALNAEMRK